MSSRTRRHSGSRRPVGGIRARADISPPALRPPWRRATHRLAKAALRSLPPRAGNRRWDSCRVAALPGATPGCRVSQTCSLLIPVPAPFGVATRQDIPYAGPVEGGSVMMRTMLAALLALAVVLPGGAQAQYYKGKTIIMIVNYPPGGPTDIDGRIVAQYLPAHVPGHPTVVV